MTSYATYLSFFIIHPLYLFSTPKIPRKFSQTYIAPCWIIFHSLAVSCWEQLKRLLYRCTPGNGWSVWCTVWDPCWEQLKRLLYICMPGNGWHTLWDRFLRLLGLFADFPSDIGAILLHPENFFHPIYMRFSIQTSKVPTFWPIFARHSLLYEFMLYVSHAIICALSLTSTRPENEQDTPGTCDAP